MSRPAALRLVRFLLRRILLVVPTTVGVVVVLFVATRVLPGDPTALIAGSQDTEEVLATIRAELGIDKPILEQLRIYLTDLLQGSLGTSWYTGNAVTSDVMGRLPATLELVTSSMLFALAIGIPLGLLVAFRPGGIADRFTWGFGMTAGGMPEFWFALMMIYVFYVVLGWVPPPVGQVDVGTIGSGGSITSDLLHGRWSHAADGVEHLILPAVTYGLLLAALVAKMTRQSAAKLVGAPYLRFATANGASRRVLTRYLLRAVVPPVATLVGVLFAYSITGTALIEAVFNWNGIGQYAVQAALYSDYVAVAGTVLVVTALSLLVYVAVDVVNYAADPRFEL